MPLDILVVDDIQESRRSLCALVSELGHRATGADSGRAALDQVRKRLPDLVLVDLLMPELDGFELTRLLRELTGERWLPVIATSSLQGDEHVIQAAGRVEELNRAALALARQDGREVTVGVPCIAVFGIELAALLARRECRVKRSGGAEYAAELGLSEWHDMGEVHYTVVLRD